MVWWGKLQCKKGTRNAQRRKKRYAIRVLLWVLKKARYAYAHAHTLGNGKTLRGKDRLINLSSSEEEL